MKRVLLFSSCVLLFAATPGDPSPAGKNGALQVVCDDAGVNHATAVPASPMNNRNSVAIQNLDTVNDIYCGFSASVTSANGIKVSKNGGYWNPNIKFQSSLPSDGGQGNNPRIYCTIAVCSATAVNQISPNDTRWVEVK